MSGKLGIVAALVLLIGCDGTSGGDVSPEDLRSVFIRRSACSGARLTPALAAILAHADGLSAAASSDLACGRSASTCDVFLACSGVDPGTPCDIATVMASCDGATLASCDVSGFARRVDCASDDDGNTTCLEDDLGRAQCATGTCEGTGALRCESDVIVFCGNGVERRSEDCTLADQRCAVTPEGDRAACVDRVEDCAADRCEGDVLLQCADGLGVDEIECPARLRGGRCAVVDGVPRCVTDTTECTDGEAACAGDVARFCVGGAWIELDCAAFQGGTCVDESEPDRPALRCAVAS